MVVNHLLLQQIFSCYGLILCLDLILDQFKVIHEEKRRNAEILQLPRKRVHERRQRFKSRIGVPHRKRKHKTSGISPRHFLRRDILRPREVLNFHSEGDSIADHCPSVMSRFTIQPNCVTDAENRFKSNTEFANLIQIIYFVRFSDVADPLKVCRREWLSVMQYFQPV